MERINFNKYKIPEKKEKTVAEPWRQYAIDTCKEFGIKFPYTQIIFKQAKLNVSFLKGKVENTKEKFGTEKLENKGRYLISLFRKKKPWEVINK